MENTNNTAAACDASLKANSISKGAVTIMAICSAAPAMCLGGSMGLLVQQTGTGVALSAAIATLVVILIGLSYGSLSEKYNCCGGTYSYVSAIFGQKAGFWTAFVYFGVTITTSGAITTIFTMYLNYLIPAIPIPLAFFFLVIPIFIINWFGIELTTKALIIVYAIQMVLILWPAIKIITMADEFVIGTAMSNAFAPGLGISGLMLAVLTWVWAYVGFEAPAYMGEELKGGSKAVKFAIPVSALCIGIVYVVACWLWTATLAPEVQAELAGSGDFLAEYAALVGWAFGDKMVALAVLTSCVGCFFGFSSMMPRFLFDLGRQGILPKGMAKVNKHQTPYVGLITYCCIAFFTCLYGNYAYTGAFDGINDIFVMMAICASIAYGFICIGQIKDKWNVNTAKGIFLGKIVPVFTTIVLGYMIYSTGPKYLLWTACWAAAALIFALVKPAKKDA